MKRKDPLSPKSKSYKEERLIKDARILRKRLEGQTYEQIARSENVSAPAIFFRLKTLNPELKQVLELNGYDLNTAVRNMIEMTRAKETRFFAKDGIVLDKRVTADNSTRTRAREIMLRVHGVDLGGVKVDQSTNTQINVLGEAERQQLMNRATKLIEVKKQKE